MTPLLTTSELAQFLGLSTQTIYNLRSSGNPDALPRCVFIGRCPRYIPSDIEAWLRANTSKAEKEAAQEVGNFQPPKKKGRPTKAQQILRRRLLGEGRTVH